MFCDTRRGFLANVGRGMLLGALGVDLAADLGVASAALADDGPATPLSFGEFEPLVALMQETEPDTLLARLVERLQAGDHLRTLTAAGALANARTFGGQDYIGFHTFMALAPAYRMARQLPAAQQALPVLKVLHRNAARIQALGGRGAEVLHALEGVAAPGGVDPGEQLRATTRSGDIDQADRSFSLLAEGPLGEAFHHLQFAVEDEVDVHRVVLAWRGWETHELVGSAWGHCLLRQSVRYCAKAEQGLQERGAARSPVREVLPKVLDQFGLLGRPLGTRVGDDVWLLELAQTLFRGERAQAAEAVAQALRDGYAPMAIGEALSLAANLLVLHDPGRPEAWANDDKPVASCHGDSVGVHASDAANAWRRIVEVSAPRNVVASLIVGAFHTAGQSGRANPQPYPLAEHAALVQATSPGAMLMDLEEAVRSKDQFRAMAVMTRYGQQGHDPTAAFQRLLPFAVSEDGALHAEKYFNTVWEEFHTMRAPFRWGQLAALARVSASSFGFRSAGYERARELLKV